MLSWDTLPETNIAPENEWLEGPFAGANCKFQGVYVQPGYASEASSLKITNLWQDATGSVIVQILKTVIKHGLPEEIGSHGLWRKSTPIHGNLRYPPAKLPKLPPPINKAY